MKFKFDYRYPLLLGIPVALLAGRLGWGAMVQFVASAIAIIPLAGFIGEATEELAVRTGPKIGGLLNATLGNAAELIITIVAIKEGVLELVIASLTGSILGNLLLVLGLSIFLGGLKNGAQNFDRATATNYATAMVLATVAIMVPAVFEATINVEEHSALQPLSLAVAGVMITVYALGIFYTFTSSTVGNPLTRESAHVHEGAWSTQKAVIVLAAATIGIVLMSEVLVGAVEEVVARLGWSHFFVGVIIVPLIGNVAEHLVAVQMALKNDMNLSVEIAMGSSLQIAMFVAPVLMFAAALLGQELFFDFNRFELVTLAAASVVAVFIFKDAESNWHEGAQLLALYIIIGIAFFYLPA